MPLSFSRFIAYISHYDNTFFDIYPIVYGKKETNVLTRTTAMIEACELNFVMRVLSFPLIV